MRDPFLVPGALVVLGVWLWPHWQPAAAILLPGLLLACLLAVLSGERSAVWLAAFCMGSLAPTALPQGPQLSGHLALRGTVAVASGSRVQLDLTHVNTSPARGRVLVKLGRERARVGEPLAVFGQARPPWESVLPGEPDPVLALRTVGIRSALQASLVHRYRPQDASRPFVHVENEGLLEALALGRRERVRPEDLELLTRTGTRHLLAISGLHVGLLAWMASGLLSLVLRPIAFWRPAPRVLPALLGGGAAMLFAWRVGWPISALRATAMVTGALLSVALGRSVRPWNLLGLAAGTIAVLEPGAVRGLSFQLSFGAVIGLFTVGAEVRRWIPPDLPFFLRLPAEGLASTLGATAGTLPVSAWVFQELPLASPLANAVAVPLVGFLATPGALLGASGWLFPQAVADTAWTLTLDWLRWVEGPVLHPAVGPLGAAALAAGLVLRELRPVLWICALGLRSVPTVDTLTVLAVGQGSAALLEGPGQRILFDAGPGQSQVLHYLRRRGIHSLDGVVLSHPHPDHTGGAAAILRELEVGVVRMPRLPLPQERSQRPILAAATLRGVSIRAGPDLHPDPDFLAEHAEDPNEISLVHRVSVGPLRVLIPGDLEKRGESRLLEWDARLRSEVLILGHHGSKTSTTPDFLAAVNPVLAIVSCGRQSRFGHPHPSVTGRLGWWMGTHREGTIQIADGRVRSWWPGRGWSDWKTVERRRRYASR